MFVTLRWKKKNGIIHSPSLALILTVKLSPNHYTTSNFSDSAHIPPNVYRTNIVRQSQSQSFIISAPRREGIEIHVHTRERISQTFSHPILLATSATIDCDGWVLASLSRSERSALIICVFLETS